MRWNQSVILISLLVLGCEYAESGSSASRELSDDQPSDRIASVTLDARRVPPDSVLRAIRDLGATDITLISFGFQESPTHPEIRFSPDVRWYSESADGARALARRAAELGMGTIIKPQLWLRGGVWTADIDFRTEDEWRVWEKHYRDYLLETARLADEIGARLLVIGTELGNPVRERPDFWRTLIGEIRSIYDGELTYGANWHDDYLDVPFWDQLDYIGVQAYFPISLRAEPEMQDLLSGWTDHVRELHGLSRRTERPVLFTEVGYRSVPYAAREPWRWPSRSEDVRADPQLQADLFRAFFQTLWSEHWFAGAIIWKYFGTDRRRSRRWDVDFTPQNKPAEHVIREWFRREG